MQGFWTCQTNERGTRYTSSREEEEEEEVDAQMCREEEEEEVDAQVCPCGEAIGNTTHMVGACEKYKEKRDVLKEEMRERVECDKEECGTLDSTEKMIAILLYGDKCWPQAAKREGDTIRKKFPCGRWNRRKERPSTVGGFFYWH